VEGTGLVGISRDLAGRAGVLGLIAAELSRAVAFILAVTVVLLLLGAVLKG
jgi:hypothetical protein